MKKTLSTILLGASLFFGANQLKGQNIYSNFINNDQDSFSEEVCGVKEVGRREGKPYIREKTGMTIIYYSDKDNDNFHEYIRVWNCEEVKQLIIEDFYIDKNTGLIDFSFEKYQVTANKWNRYFANKPWINHVRENPHENLKCIHKKVYSNLTEQDIYNLYPGSGERIKRLMNASKNEDALKNMLRQERLVHEK